jgi:hypothetical protein
VTLLNSALTFIFCPNPPRRANLSPGFSSAVLDMAEYDGYQIGFSLSLSKIQGPTLGDPILMLRGFDVGDRRDGRKPLHQSEMECRARFSNARPTLC